MKKTRLDQLLYERRQVASRSQAESYIKLGYVLVDGKKVIKPGTFVSEDAITIVTAENQYVSRAALKLASISDIFKLDFKSKVMLDVGSSTGGFTDFALKNGAKKVFAVDVGTNQLHPSLHGDPRIELHEQTDIRDFKLPASQKIDIVVIDVSFISSKEILPAVSNLSSKNTQIVLMLKPQFEAGKNDINKGVVKNNSIRRDIMKNFEVWAANHFVIRDKADSGVAGSKGNLERFYLLARR